MSCNCCQQTKPISNCVTTIVIGTITNLSTAVYVYFKNKSTDKIFRFSATSSGAGLVSITVGNQKFTNNHAYECWITLASATNLEEKLPVTISGMTGTYTCFLVPFYHVQDNSNAPVSYSSQTLKYDTDYPCYDAGFENACSTCPTQTTGTLIDFAAPQIFGTASAPESGDITENLVNANMGIVQKIYHTSNPAPTFPASWVLLGTTTYSAGGLNIIFCEYSSPTRVEYWITQ